MPSRDSVHYFGAGPAPILDSVLEEASAQILNYNNTGIGLVEISHRGPEAAEILSSTKATLRKLLDIPESDGPDGYEILFLHGGGSGQFSSTIYNMVAWWVAKQWKYLKESKFLGLDEEVVIAGLRDLVQEKMKLDYFVTGAWSLKASQEAARLVGAENVNIVTDSRKYSKDGKSFTNIPSRETWTPTQDEADCVMTYYCDNETVDGVEFPEQPTGHNLVADMSSNILSRPIDVRAHMAIFAGAQKNIGTTGITIAIVSNKILPPTGEYADPALLRKLGLPVGPVVLDWPTIKKNKSLYNTLPILDVWVAGRVMDKILSQSGEPPFTSADQSKYASEETSKTVSASPRISAQHAESNKKASLLYSSLDAYPEIYQVVPDKSVRSRMNLCFRIKHGDEQAEKAFVKGAEAKGLLGLKGHRSVGGMRVSNYNAVTVAATEELRRYLIDFAEGKAETNGVAKANGHANGSA